MFCSWVRNYADARWFFYSSNVCLFSSFLSFIYIQKCDVRYALNKYKRHEQKITIFGVDQLRCLRNDQQFG